MDLESLIEAFRGQDVVIHSAALVSFSKKDKNLMMKTNVEGTANVVNACLAANVKKLIHVSSVAAIGRPHQSINNSETTVVSENHKWENSPLNSNYAISKYHAELEVWRGEAEGLKVAVINPSIILGECDITKSSGRLFEYIWKENIFWVDGRVNYVDLNDVIKSIQLILKNDLSGKRYILNGGNTSYKNLFTKMAEGLNKKPPSIKLGNLTIEILWRLEKIRSIITGSEPLITKETSVTARTNILYDSSKIVNELNFAFTPLEQTISRVSKYIVDKYRS